MPSTTRYAVPARTHRVETEIRRSRFITSLGRAASVEQAVDFVKAVSEEFSDATHNCWAYVAGPPGSTDRIGMSDNGEPHGTAGRPMLNALLHSGVGEVVAVVTRYFGGTKLGTGGLVRAYGGGVQQALATLPTTDRVDLAPLVVEIDYARVASFQQLLTTFGAEVVAQSFGTGATFELRLPASSIDAFRAAVLDRTRGQARFLHGFSRT
jgi:uncharacterized YigZ family protein